MREPIQNIYPDPVDGCLLNRVLDQVFSSITRMFKRPRVTLLVPEPMVRDRLSIGQSRITEIYTRTELLRMIEGAAYDLAHAAAREHKMTVAMPVGRGPVHDYSARLYDLRRRLDLRLEQDAGRLDIEQRAKGIAAEIMLVAGTLQGGDPAVAYRKLAEIAIRVQARDDTAGVAR